MRASWLWALSPLPLLSQVGLVTEAGSALLRRNGDHLAVAARQGDLLYPGDIILSAAGGAIIQFCPTREEYGLTTTSEITVEDSQLRFRRGQPAGRRTIPFCVLPQVDLKQGQGLRFLGSRISRDQQERPAVNGEENYRAQISGLPEDVRRTLAEQLEPVERALDANSKDATARLALASTLGKFGLHSAAAVEYRKLADSWVEIDWPRQLEHEQMDRMRRQKTTPPVPRAPGKTYALIVGVSKYPRLPLESQLKYAHLDAAVMAQYLQSGRGGALPPEQVRLLTDSAATASAIRNMITTFLKAKAGKNDTVILFLAAHGVVDDSGAYIVTSDSDPEDLMSTALRMSEVQSLLDEEFANVGRVMIYVDVCRAGMIGTLRRNDVHRVVEVLIRRDTESLGILASGPGEFSVESERFGGGHGAFTYFLARGLNGDADEDKDGKITSGELFDYVWDHVRLATKKKQNPRQTGSMPRTEPIAGNLGEAGIRLAEWKDLESIIAQSRNLERRSIAAPPEIIGFEDAVTDGRIRPESAEAAFRALRDLRRQSGVSRQAVMAIENRLSIVLQDQGQQVILRYLRGDAVPQSKSDFSNGELYFRTALDLDPDAWALRSRALFCHGRSAIFDKRYKEAIQLLERAVRIEPEAAYGWNALGIGYLESADYIRAAQAFRDAIRRAPRWVYPRHNLALALSEQGEIADAEAAYREAMRLAPGLGYLPYNLGLLFQRTNRRGEAEAMFRRAIALAPDSPEAYNALGLLKATNKKHAEAEALYRQALEKKPGFLPARHNLALILASRSETAAESVRLWQQNLTDDPDFMPSRVSLAETLAQQGRTADAIREYRELILRRPEYFGARLGLAEQLEREGHPAEAAEVLRESVRIAPDEPAFCARLGDLLLRMGKPAEAEDAYMAALSKTLDPRTRKQLQKKLQTFQTP